jgi:hypothetical protein
MFPFNFISLICQEQKKTSHQNHREKLIALSNVPRWIGCTIMLDSNCKQCLQEAQHMQDGPCEMQASGTCMMRQLGVLSMTLMMIMMATIMAMVDADLDVKNASIKRKAAAK